MHNHHAGLSQVLAERRITERWRQAAHAGLGRGNTCRVAGGHRNRAGLEPPRCGNRTGRPCPRQAPPARPSTSKTAGHQLRHPLITAQLLRQAQTAAASELSAGCQRPGAGSGQPGGDRANSPPGCGPRPPQDQGIMSRLTLGLVPRAMLVLSGPGIDQPIRQRPSRAPRWE